MTQQISKEEKKKKDRKMFLQFIVFIVLITGGYFLVTEVLFPMLGGKRTPVEYVAVDDNHVILLTENSKYHSATKRSDGTYTDSYTEAKGYSVALFNVDENKKVDRVDIKLPKRGSKHERAIMFLGDSGKVYLVFNPKPDKKVVQEVRVVQVKGDQLEVLPNPDMKGLSFVEFYIHSARLTNSANEQHCFNYKTGNISKGNCNSLENIDSAEANRTGRFFFYYDSAPELFILYYLKFTNTKTGKYYSNGYMINQRFKPGQNPYLSGWDFDPEHQNLKSPEYLQKMNHPSMLRDPKILMETDSTLLMMAGGESKNKFYYFSSKNMQWSIEIPTHKGNGNYPEIRILTTEKSFIISSMDSWVISIDKEKGILNWKYPKDK